MRGGSEREPPDTERVVAHAVEPATVVPEEARRADQRARWRQAAVAGGLPRIERPGAVEGALAAVHGGEPALEELRVTDLGSRNRRLRLRGAVLDGRGPVRGRLRLGVDRAGD